MKTTNKLFGFALCTVIVMGLSLTVTVTSGSLQHSTTVMVSVQ
jgi:hypothetical protein